MQKQQLACRRLKLNRSAAGKREFRDTIGTQEEGRQGHTGKKGADRAAYRQTAGKKGMQAGRAGGRQAVGREAVGRRLAGK